MTDAEKNSNRFERQANKILRDNKETNVIKKKQRKVKKSKQNSRFVKFWLPIKKAIWLYRGIIDFSTLSVPQVEYLKNQLERELKGHYEGK
jgi:hypothetical protein